jgi:NAD(P)-dependent dehydrogenase (short-subunit alcohol dehydrogenase family)
MLTVSQTNYISHWLLTYHILPLLQQTAKTASRGDVRVVNLSSVGHMIFAPSSGIAFEDMSQLKGGPWSRYGQSKVANILHTRELNRRYGPLSKYDGNKVGEIWTASVHPGTVTT